MKTLVSFGTKYGNAPPGFIVSAIPAPNPHKIATLRALRGTDPCVARMVLRSAGGVKVVQRVLDAVSKHDVVAVACYGGKHRSVAIVEEAARLLRAAGQEVSIHHRDINRR